MFVTFSPGEGHNLFMIRLSRTQRNDPLMKNKFTKPQSHCYASDMPNLNASSEDIVLVASVEDMAQTLPSHDPRTIILATDALASVDGCRIMVHLTFQHLRRMFVFVKFARLQFFSRAMSGYVW